MVYPTVSRSGVSIVGTLGEGANVMVQITPQTLEKDADSGAALSQAGFWEPLTGQKVGF